MITISTQIAISAIGVILGVTILDFSKRLLIKQDFRDKPLEVTIED